MKLSEHPRATRHIRLAKGWGGLAGFLLVAFLSWRAHVPWFELGLRALIGGIAAHLVAWAAAVHIWRHLAVAEVRAAHARLRAPSPAAPPRATTAEQAEA